LIRAFLSTRCRPGSWFRLSKLAGVHTPPMSQETTTQLPGLSTGHDVLAEDGEAFSAAEVDQHSASRMPRVLMLFPWALAGAVLVSALFGHGTDLSNKLAGGWFAVFSFLLLAWPRMNLFWHRGIAVAILLLIVTRWSMSWLYAEQADAIIGVMIGLLYTPVVITIITLLWGRLSLYIGAGTGLVMGFVAYVGSSREALAGAYLNDWRIAPLILGVYGVFSWLLNIWVRERGELREAVERVDRLRKAADTDTLTGIANRRVAERALNLFATGQRRYAVMMIDIDHFKAINDQHGHDTGDRILQRIAEILKARMRVQDTVARWGGEEFLVIVESVTREESAAIAESLRNMVEQGTGEILKTTISIGVVHSDSGQSADQILTRADEGLYAAKKSGRNKVVTV
jgi:diguanylate cyclase (GGDEF)-like protein